MCIGVLKADKTRAIPSVFLEMRMYSILYVDDEEILLGLNKIYLERGGEFSVDTSASAPDALKKLCTVSYDAIISDYDMPGMDGIAFLKEVRLRHGSLPFLLFTGKGREEVVIEAVDNGVDYYVQKGSDMLGMIAELRHKILRSIERRRIVDELERSRQQMNDIINFLPDATFVRDIHGTVIAWNHAMEQMTGVSRNAMMGKDNFEYSLPLYHERRPLLADLVLQEDPEIDTRYRFFQRDGDKISSEIFIPHLNGNRGARLWVTASPLYDADGAVTGAIESFRDITDYYSVKRDLELSREMNQGFADMVPVGVYEMDLSCTLTFSNRVCRELFGLSDTDLLETITILDFIDPSDRDRARADIMDVARGKVSKGQEYLLRRKDHSTFPSLIIAGMVVDPESQKPIGVRGIIVDLTERKREARALHDSRELLAIALAAGDSGIWDMDLCAMKVYDIQEWACRALGYLPGDLPVITLDTCTTLVHPLDMPGIMKSYLLHQSGIEPLFLSEFRLAAKDRSWVRVAVRGKVIERNAGNEPVRLTGIISVVSRQKA